MISKYFKTKAFYLDFILNIQLRYWCTHLLIAAEYIRNNFEFAFIQGDYCLRNHHKKAGYRIFGKLANSIWGSFHLNCSNSSHINPDYKIYLEIIGTM